MEVNELRLEAKDLNQQGALLLRVRNIQGAKEKFDKAIELDPMLMDSYKNYGDLYMAEKNTEMQKTCTKRRF